MNNHIEFKFQSCIMILIVVIFCILLGFPCSRLLHAGDVRQTEELYTEGMREYEHKNYHSAVKLLKPAADNGHVGAQAILGLCYAEGLGVSKNIVEAMQFLRKAANQGDVSAQLQLGYRLGEGHDVPQDLSEAVKWYRMAAEVGNAELAFYILGDWYYRGHGVKQDYAEAAKWLHKSADSGNVISQYTLGNCYMLGQGVAQDAIEAVKWYNKAAYQEHGGAQYVLGICYAEGLGVKKEPFQAVTWYRKAAEKGHAEAQFALYEIYTFWGRVGQFKDIDTNENEAQKWLHLAADQGYAKAQTALGFRHELGQIGKGSDYMEAVNWYRKAVEQDFPEAYERLGSCLASGRGIPKNYSDALKFYYKAAEKGFRSASDILAIIKYEEQYAPGESKAQVMAWEKITNDFLNDFNGNDFDWRTANVEFAAASAAFAVNDYVSAAQWYRKAAERGFAEAQERLAFLYSKGLGVESNGEEFAKWIFMAMEQGEENAIGRIGLIYENKSDFASAMKLYRASSYRGSLNYNCIISLAQKGNNEALRWLKGVAENGHSSVQSSLGFMYRDGNGVTQDYLEAIKWWEMNLTNVDDMHRSEIFYLIAECYAEIGNTNEAIKWYRGAALQGYADAQTQLGIYFLYLEQKFDEAVQWFQLAVDQENAAALYHLGVCYAEGKGLDKNRIKAVELFEKSAMLGFEPAQKKLKALDDSQ